MGKRGPKRTPTKILALRGSPKAIARRATDLEPQSEASDGIPSPPMDLSIPAEKVWNHLCLEFDNRGIFTTVDSFTLARYCVMWCEWKKAMRFVHDNGETYETTNKNGDKVLRPWPQVTIAMKYSEQLLRIEQQFGMTPASRSSIEVQPQRRGDRRLTYFPKRRVKGA